MSKKKAQSAAQPSAVQSKATPDTLKYNLSPARQEELERKIEEGKAYYLRTFGRELTAEEVVAIMTKIVERDKERLFINKISPISEADMLWYAGENDVEVYGERQGEESAGGNGGAEGEALSGAGGAGQASNQA